MIEKSSDLFILTNITNEYADQVEVSFSFVKCDMSISYMILIFFPSFYINWYQFYIKIVDWWIFFFWTESIIRIVYILNFSSFKNQREFLFQSFLRFIRHSFRLLKIYRFFLNCKFRRLPLYQYLKIVRA